MIRKRKEEKRIKPNQHTTPSDPFSGKLGRGVCLWGTLTLCRGGLLNVLGCLWLSWNVKGFLENEGEPAPTPEGECSPSQLWSPRALTSHCLFPRCLPHPLPDDAGSGRVTHLLPRSVTGPVCQPGTSVCMESHPGPTR